LREMCGCGLVCSNRTIMHTHFVCGGAAPWDLERNSGLTSVCWDARLWDPARSDVKRCNVIWRGFFKLGVKLDATPPAQKPSCNNFILKQQNETCDHSGSWRPLPARKRRRYFRISARGGNSIWYLVHGISADWEEAKTNSIEELNGNANGQ